MDDSRLKYLQHKANAKQRGLEFEFTFEEWWEIWEPHFHNRGRNKGMLQMCRTRDEGGYTPGNVRIDTVESNRREAKHSLLRRDIKRDWTIDGVDCSANADWCSKPPTYGMDYFRAKVIEEREKELADDE